MWAPTTRLQHPISVRTQVHRRHPKVCNLDILVFVEEKILRLEVPMANVEVMTVVETSNDLLKVVGSF